MTAANPLVAEPQSSSSFWAGTGIGEDISDLGQAIGNGSWLFGSLAGVGLAGDVVFMVFNPIAAAVSAGLGWLIEHIHPLDEMLEKVTGDADAVMAVVPGRAPASTSASCVPGAQRLGVDTQLIGDPPGSPP